MNIKRLITTLGLALITYLPLSAQLVPLQTRMNLAIDIHAINTPGYAVIEPTPRGGIGWETRGSAAAKDGVDHARSRTIGHGQSSVLSLTLTRPGTLKFWWKVDSEPDDKLSFEISSLDGLEISTPIAPISGNVGWTEVTVAIPGGTTTVTWTYKKDNAGTGGTDYAWLDMVRFTPSTVSPTMFVDAQTNVASGPFGGPFIDTLDYEIHNTGSSQLSYSISAESIPSWMVISPIGGTINPGLVMPITISVRDTSASQALTVGRYEYVIVFKNNTTGQILKRRYKLDVEKAEAWIGIEGLTQQWNGSQRRVTVTTSPANLGHTITYNRSTTPPTAVGYYTVAVQINDSNFYGTKIGIMQITPGANTITFNAPSPVYVGSTYTLGATASSGLTVSYSSSDPTVGKIINNSQVQILKKGTFVITATQGGNSTIPAATAVTRTITVGNRAPVAQNVAYTAELGGPWRPIDMKATDPDGDPLTFTVVTPPTKGAFSGSTVSSTTLFRWYIPNSTTAAGSTDYFEYRVSDGSATSNTARVDLAFVERHKPYPTGDRLYLPDATAGSAYQFSLAPYFRDDQGQAITLTFVNSPTNPSWLSLNATTGVLSGTPPPGTVAPAEGWSFKVDAKTGDTPGLDSWFNGTSTLLTCHLGLNNLPLPWVSKEISPLNKTYGKANFLEYLTGTSFPKFSQAGAGSLGGSFDSLRFTYRDTQSFQNNYGAVVVLNLGTSTGTSQRVGCMFRESLAPGAKFIFIGTNGTAWQMVSRSTTHGQTTTVTNTTALGTQPKMMLKQTTSGITVSVRGPNATNVQVGSFPSTFFSTTPLFGIVSCSGSESTLQSSQFSVTEGSNVSL